MHRSNISDDAALFYHYIDDIDILHRYNELLYFFCMIKEDQGR